MKYFAVLALCIVGAIASPTAEQVSLVRSTWDQVRNNEVDILYAVFKAYPDIQARFPRFNGQDLDSLRGGAAFATHAGRIVGFFSEVIVLLGNESNTPAYNTLIAELARNHRNRGIPQAQFNEFRTALVGYVQSNAQWNENVATAFNAALDYIYGNIFASL